MQGRHSPGLGVVLACLVPVCFMVFGFEDLVLHGTGAGRWTPGCSRGWHDPVHAVPAASVHSHGRDRQAAR